MTALTPSSSLRKDALEQAIFRFDHPHAASHDELVHLLGGKGAGLAEMTNALGISVPPGFTISVPVCHQYLEHGWPVGLDDALATFTEDLGRQMGRRLGDPTDPLLVAVRSGAPVSMPGMLDTVLNLGLNDDTVAGLAAVSRDERFAWDSYRRFLTMYAVTVMGVDPAILTEPVADGDDLHRHVADLKGRIREAADRDVPVDPVEQLRGAVEAVFRSWNSPRAKTYRDREGIDPDLGTAVTVQAMVFGNRGEKSGTGVVFTRDPATGHKVLYGDYLPRAQGEDVVAGTSRTLHVADLAAIQPDIFSRLHDTLADLERHFRDMCDVEFTVEEGKLWLLQTRVGKRSACAAVRIAVAMATDPGIGLTPAEAVARVSSEVRDRARDEAVAHVADEHSGPKVVTKGLGASPGRATGRVVLTSEAAADADDEVILVRPETSPEDVAGMAASVGLLTTTGGLVSHAAVVARGWGIPAVVGAHDLRCSTTGVVTPEGRTITEGDIITIDGTSGCVWLGAVDPPSSALVRKAVETELPELLVLQSWADALDVKGK